MSQVPEDIIEQIEPEDQDVTVQRVRLRVGRRSKGKRIDKYLQGRFRQFSRTTIQKMIREGAITVNDRPTKCSYPLNPGDVIELVVPEPEPREIVPEPIPLDILYEDDHIIVLNKQAGIICHPARPSQTGTLANALAWHSQQLSDGSDPARPGIVHRLDKNTTGVMIAAKTNEAHFRLGWQFERRTIEKVYLAVVHKVLELDEDIINAPLAKHPVIKDKYLVPGSRYYNQVTKEAITRYRVIERFSGYTFMELRPKTGRTHQLRVHMSYIGHPIVGDVTYGGRIVTERDIAGSGSDQPVITRQALHAWKIKFMHPISEKMVEFEAPLPDDFRKLLDLLRQHRGAPKKIQDRQVP